MGRSICHWPPYNKQKNLKKEFMSLKKWLVLQKTWNSGIKDLLINLRTEEDFQVMFLEFLNLHFSTKYQRSRKSVLRVKVLKKILYSEAIEAVQWPPEQILFTKWCRISRAFQWYLWILCKPISQFVLNKSWNSLFQHVVQYSILI